MQDSSGDLTSEQLKQEDISPSIINSVGVILLFISGFILVIWPLLQLLPTITFENVTWPIGPVIFDDEQTGGYTGFSRNRQVYHVVVARTTATIDAFAQSDVLFEQGLCLTVNAHVASGQPDAYGVILRRSQGNTLRLSVNEQEHTVQLWLVKGTSSEAVTGPKDIQDALNGVGPDKWHSIQMAIRPERIEVWLNHSPVLDFDSEHLSVEGVGVFALSGDNEDAVPVRVNFSKFEAAPFLFSWECRPQHSG